MRILVIADDKQENIDAEAFIAIVRRNSGYGLEIVEDGNLTEAWWRELPSLMQDTVDKAMKARQHGQQI